MVLAAGGIADGRGLAAALMLGADGAWVGTRLVATDESLAHEDYKARLVSAAATDTVRTSVFGPEMPEFNPMRVLRNRAIDEPHTEERPIIGRTRLGDEVIDLPRYTSMVPMRGLTTGDMDEMPLLSGQGVGLVDAVKGAASVIADMTAQAADSLSRYPAGAGLRRSA
jgi:NAD(P)H-dependent flavin oxidoreductase YrpB (nitropropane dioxygenase family)